MLTSSESAARLSESPNPAASKAKLAPRMSVSLADAADMVAAVGIRLLSVEQLAALFTELWLNVEHPVRTVLLAMQLEEVA